MPLDVGQLELKIGLIGLVEVVDNEVSLKRVENLLGEEARVAKGVENGGKECHVHVLFGTYLFYGGIAHTQRDAEAVKHCDNAGIIDDDLSEFGAWGNNGKHGKSRKGGKGGKSGKNGKIRKSLGVGG